MTRSTVETGADYPASAQRTIGRVLAGLVNCLNPAAIILGGELGSAGDPLAAGVRESIDRHAGQAGAKAVTIAAGWLGPRAELLGAVVPAIRRSGRGAES